MLYRVGEPAEGQIGIVTALVRCAFLLDAVYTESAKEYGLTPQQGQLLCVLMARPYGMGELGTTLGLAKSSLTGLVDRTERNGLVKRIQDIHDTRAVRVALTRKGSELAAGFHALTSQRIGALPSGLSAAERDTLAGLLGSIVTNNKVPVIFIERDESLAKPT